MCTSSLREKPFRARTGSPLHLVTFLLHFGYSWLPFWMSWVPVKYLLGSFDRQARWVCLIPCLCCCQTSSSNDDMYVALGIPAVTYIARRARRTQGAGFFGTRGPFWGNKSWAPGNFSKNIRVASLPKAQPAAKGRGIVIS